MSRAILLVLLAGILGLSNFEAQPYEAVEVASFTMMLWTRGTWMLNGRMTCYAPKVCAEESNYGVYDDRQVPMANYFNGQSLPKGEAK